MEIINKELLSRHTTFKIGGKAEYFISISRESDVILAVSFAKGLKLPMYILGAGSNVLFADKGYAGIVMKMDIVGITVGHEGKDIYLTIGAGEKWDQVVMFAVNHGWAGIENLSAIPGTVGAAPVQNIGAYGTELKKVLDSVRVYNVIEGKFEQLSVGQCRLGYRDSIFKHPAGKKYIITSVTLKLSKKYTPSLKYPDINKYFADNNIPAPTLKNVRQAVIGIRREKLPDWHELGNAGSFFKNPVISKIAFKKLLQKYPDIIGHNIGDKVKLSSAQLIDKLDYKGKRFGKVGVYDKHALILVNYGGGKARDILKLAKKIIVSVKHRFGVVLVPEVNVLTN